MMWNETSKLNKNNIQFQKKILMWIIFDKFLKIGQKTVIQKSGVDAFRSSHRRDCWASAPPSLGKGSGCTTTSMIMIENKLFYS